MNEKIQKKTWNLSFKEVSKKSFFGNILNKAKDVPMD
jgi:hypothetical protein